MRSLHTMWCAGKAFLRAKPGEENLKNWECHTQQTEAMFSLAPVVLGLFAICYTTHATVCTSKEEADIFIFLDASGSLKLPNFKTTLNFSKAVAESFNIGPDSVRIGLATFSNFIGNVMQLDRYSNKPDLLEAIDQIRYTRGSTRTHLALKAAREKFFTEQNGGRDQAPQFLILVTDGKSTFPQQTKAEAALLAKTNITTIAIGIGGSVNKDELNLIASSSKLVFTVKNFQELSDIKTDVVKYVCEALPVELPKPTPSNFQNDASIPPPPRFVSRKSSPPPGSSYREGRTFNIAADIFILLDTSFTTGVPDFNKLLDFSRQIVHSFIVSPYRVRIGVATFSTFASEEIKLNQYRQKANLLKAIGNMRYKRGPTPIYRALKAARERFFTVQNGGREGVPHFLILVRSGYSTNIREIKTESALLAKANIHTLTIGIGGSVNKNALTLIATSPSFVFYPQCTDNGVGGEIGQCVQPHVVEGYSSESELVSVPMAPRLVQVHIDRRGAVTRHHVVHVLFLSAPPVKLPKPTPGSLQKDARVLKPLRSVSSEGCTSKDKADIFIFLDASSSLKLHNFRMTLNFSKDIVESFDIGPDSVRIGLATFSNIIRNRIMLDRYSNKSGLQGAIDKIWYTKGSTHTHAALKVARERYFAQQNGGRDTVPHFLILVTDGKSTHPQKTKAEAALLAKTNITTIAIGIGRSVRKNELKLIASSPNLVFYVKNFQDLSGIKTDVVKHICEEKTGPREIAKTI
ncbi:hypothetical protein RRG08_022958 [Elysia crispata]|uniref:VWFA domain-containing protein n=1 Tax=Elysia crispata TaxID=231223 RepID=A0AAE1AEB8_9GAST|nr:hypothetical protein RRG08_022958 [Elysia crispata]